MHYVGNIRDNRFPGGNLQEKRNYGESLGQRVLQKDTSMIRVILTTTLDRIYLSESSEVMTQASPINRKQRQ